MTKIANGFKDKIASLFNTNTPKNMCVRGKKLSKPKTQKRSKENKINSIRNHFVPKKEIRKKIIDRIKDRIIRDVWILFETEEEEIKIKKFEKERN